MNSKTLKGRYIAARNAWEVAWNAALDKIDAWNESKRKEDPNEIDPYREAWSASDLERVEAAVPRDEWDYERCVRYSLLELENLKKLQDWARKYMPDEQTELEKRKQDRIKCSEK